MEKVRIGNDLRVNFSVYRNGEPESFDGATNISTKIVNESYNKTIAHTYLIVGNVVQFEIDALELKQCGKCRVFISYTKVGDYTVDSPAFELVQHTEDTGGTEVIGIEIVKINISGDIGINRDGASAYEVWESYPGNEGKTIEQYFEWLRENPTKIDLDGLNSNIDKLHFKPDTLVQLANIGDVRYSTESKTLEVKVSDTVSIQLGQEMQTRVKNDESIQINNGQMVYINSAVGANPLAKIASTSNADIAQRTFGMATENIPANGFGAITTEGLVRDINTSSFPEGSMLWLGTNGNVTNIEPTAPTSKISVGMVLRSNVANGVIYVKIRAIARNQKLSDVYAPTLTGGDVLRWNNTTLRFETFNITSALSNKVDTSRTITAGNGLTGGGSLTEDRTININPADDSLTVTADNVKVNTNNTLTSTSTTQPLSANQGKVLNEKVVQVETDLNDLAYSAGVDNLGLMSVKEQTIIDIHRIYPDFLVSPGYIVGSNCYGDGTVVSKNYTYKPSLGGITVGGIKLGVWDNNVTLTIGVVDIDLNNNYAPLAYTPIKVINAGDYPAKSEFDVIFDTDITLSDSQRIYYEGIGWWENNPTTRLNYKGSYFNNTLIASFLLYLIPIQVDKTTISGYTLNLNAVKELETMSDAIGKCGVNTDGVVSINSLQGVALRDYYPSFASIEEKSNMQNYGTPNVTAYNTNAMFRNLTVRGIRTIVYGNSNDFIVGKVNVLTNTYIPIKTINAGEYPANEEFYVEFEQDVNLTENETIYIKGDIIWGFAYSDTSIRGVNINGGINNTGVLPIYILYGVPTTIEKKNIDIKDIGIVEINKNKQFIGSMDYEPFPSDGYAHILLYGQSLSTGANSYIPVTGVLTDIVDGTYMLGNSPTYQNDILTSGLEQLKAAPDENFGNHGECPIVNAVYALKKMLNKTPYRNVKLIASAPGRGATTIEQLTTTYYPQFQKTVARLGELLPNNIVCPSIIWMQGEYNQGSGSVMTVNEYKSAMVALKDKMQLEVKTNYSQVNNPLLFVYQTGKNYTPQYPIVAEALRQLSEEYEDIILLNPHYYCPTTDQGHLSVNGYRWYGEHIAKALFDVLYSGNRFNPVKPTSFNVINNLTETYIDVILNVPQPPIVFDTNLIGRKCKNYGFSVYDSNNNPVIIRSVQIIAPTIIRIITDTLIGLTGVQIEYAGKLTNGVGNVRDSDAYVPYSKYLDVSTIYTQEASSAVGYSPSTYIAEDLTHTDSDGSTLVGKKYKMHNWLSHFRTTIN